MRSIINQKFRRSGGGGGSGCVKEAGYSFSLS